MPCLKIPMSCAGATGATRHAVVVGSPSAIPLYRRAMSPSMLHSRLCDPRSWAYLYDLEVTLLGYQQVLDKYMKLPIQAYSAILTPALNGLHGACTQVLPSGIASCTGHWRPQRQQSILGGSEVAFEDKDLVCRECGATFNFSAGEQEFYQSRGLMHEPARCPTCRAARRRGGFQSDQPRVMYPAVCDSCGIETEVPFQPRQGRPVYCNDCFKTARESQPI